MRSLCVLCSSSGGPLGVSWGLLGGSWGLSGGPLGGQKLSQRSPTLGSSDSVEIEKPRSKNVNSSRTVALGWLNGVNSLGKLSPDVTIHAACARFETPAALRPPPPNEPNCLLLLEVLRSLRKLPQMIYVQKPQTAFFPQQLCCKGSR